MSKTITLWCARLVRGTFSKDSSQLYKCNRQLVFFFKSLGGKAEKAINIIINYPYLPVTWSKYLVPVVGDICACLLWFKQPEEQSNIVVKKVNESVCVGGGGRG